MKKYLLPLLSLLLLVGSCDKDKFPDEFTLIGQWLEKTADANKIELEFTRGNRVYINFPSSTIIDTMNYKLDKENELKLYRPQEYPNGKYSLHRISYSSRKEELAIFGLVPSLDGNPSRNIFKRK
ncbi:hypothetical protein MASR1M74_01290 [Lentimicrobium sp.]